MGRERKKKREREGIGRSKRKRKRRGKTTTHYTKLHKKHIEDKKVMGRKRT